MKENKHKIKGLGEIVLRAKSVETLVNFYRDVVGLEILSTVYDWTFFKIAPGHGGYTQALAISPANTPLWNDGIETGQPDQATSTIHHFSFNLLAEDYDSEVQRLINKNCVPKQKEHTELGWRSSYFEDPKGNIFEFVCFDEKIQS